MNNKDLSAFFLANCGVLLEYQNHQILIDGLFQRPAEAIGSKDGLSCLPEDLLQMIMNRQTPFDHLELLLFTHTHWDHADIELANAYVQKYNAEVYYPKDNDSDFVIKKEWVTIEKIHTAHDVPSNPDHKKHCCYKVRIAGKLFLFTGDLDVMHEVDPVLYQDHIDYLFYNVHHILQSEGRALVTGKFQPDHIYIQHLPFPEDDVYHLNKRIHNKLHVFGAELPPCTILETPMQQLL